MINSSDSNDSAPVTDVLYLAGNGNYTWFCMTNGRRKLTSRTLSYYSPTLPDFIRIHKSYLINPAYVLSLAYTSPESGVISMQDLTQLPIAKRRIREVHRVLKQWPVEVSHPYYGLSQKPV